MVSFNFWNFRMVLHFCDANAMVSHSALMSNQLSDQELQIQEQGILIDSLIEKETYLY